MTKRLPSHGSGKTGTWLSETHSIITVGWAWDCSSMEVESVRQHGSDSISEQKHIKLSDLGIRLVREGGPDGTE